MLNFHYWHKSTTFTSNIKNFDAIFHKYMYALHFPGQPKET